MNINISTSNYFRTASHAGIRQKIERRKPFELPGGLQLWQAVGKVLLWGLPVILGINLWCASSIDTQRIKSVDMQQKLEQLRNGNNELQIQVNRLTSPVRVKIAAAEKLGLHVPTPDQVQRM